MADSLQIAVERAATPEQVQGSVEWTVREVQEAVQASQQAPSAQLRALSNKMGSLEGSILHAGGS